MFSTTGVTQQQQEAVAHIAAMPQHRGHTIEVEGDGGWLLITMVGPEEPREAAAMAAEFGALPPHPGVVEYLVGPNGDWDRTVRVVA